MSNQEWFELQVGDCVDCLESQYAKNLIVHEIAEDERSLRNWVNRGYNVQRIIRFEGENGFHTWCGFPERWKKNFRN